MSLSYLHANCIDSDQTGWVPRLIQLFTGHTSNLFCHIPTYLMIILGYFFLFLHEMYAISSYLNSLWGCSNGGINHVFLCINTCWALTGVLKIRTLKARVSKPEEISRYRSNMHQKIMFDHLLHKSILLCKNTK